MDKNLNGKLRKIIVRKFDEIPYALINNEGNRKFWVYATIGNLYNLSHPAAENRTFGVESNRNGGYTFFTRGVDRIADELFGGLRDFLKWSAEQTLDNGFDPLDRGSIPWIALQDQLTNYINEEGGTAAISDDFNHRPQFDEIEPYLEGEIGLNDLTNPCE